MLNRSNIEEANKHLQALHSRIQDLEQVVSQQQDALASKDSFIHTKISELSQQDAVLQQQSRQLEEHKLVVVDRERKIKDLESNLESKECEMLKLKRQNKTLGKLLEVIPEFKSLVNKLENISSDLDCASENGDQGNYQNHTLLEADGTDRVDNDEAFATDNDSTSIIAQSSTQQILKSLRSNGRLEKFSISEDERTKDESDKSSTKELYF